MAPNKTYDFCQFCTDCSQNWHTHDIDWTYTMYLTTKCIDQNNVTHVSMATKYPIVKHRAFFKTLTIFISANNEDIGQKFLPDTYDHALMVYKMHDLKRSKFKVTSWIHCLARCCKISLTEPDTFFIILFIDTSRDTISDKN